MFNPFSKGAGNDSADTELVEQTRHGDRAELEQLIVRHQAWVRRCGLVSTNNPCRRAKKTKGSIDGGHVDPDHLLFVPLHVRTSGLSRRRSQCRTSP